MKISDIWPIYLQNKSILSWNLKEELHVSVQLGYLICSLMHTKFNFFATINKQKSPSYILISDICSIDRARPPFLSFNNLMFLMENPVKNWDFETKFKCKRAVNFFSVRFLFSLEEKTITIPRTTFNATSLHLTTVPFGLLEEDDTDNNIRIPYKWLFITTFPLCIILGIVIVCLSFQKYRNRRDIDTTYIENSTPAHQNVTHVYDFCTEETEHGRRQSQSDNSPTTTSENIYLTVVERGDSNVYD